MEEEEPGPVGFPSRVSEGAFQHIRNPGQV
jgi:hypothetical protein